MSETAFESLADSLLAADPFFQGGEGTWVVNKHAPTRQIWLSSPKSGARHYAFDAASGLWKDTRGGDDLLAHLSAELGVALEWTPS